MKHITWLLKWILRAAIFFALLAFALNNQQDVTVQFFFDHEWTAPMVLVVLVAFALGLAAGILGMLPRWLKQRRAARRASRYTETASDSLTPPHASHES